MEGFDNDGHKEKSALMCPEVDDEMLTNADPDVRTRPRRTECEVSLDMLRGGRQDAHRRNPRCESSDDDGHTEKSALMRPGDG